MNLNSNYCNNTCIICKKSDDLPVFYGDFLKKSKIAAHYFCLLFSYELQQRGKDKSGLLGFLLSDIKKYAQKIKFNKCLYCKENSASLKCYICKISFHFICGVKNKCHYEFIGNFRSYCHLHIQIYHKQQHPDNQLCIICLKAMGSYHPVLSIAPNCCPDKWLHRSCLMKYALSAGYYVKCFWCQNKGFRDQIRSEGVFVPDRDASWERSPDAYIDLHRPHRKCDSENCNCPQGKEFQAKSGIWSMVLCCMCGAYSLHMGCIAGSSSSNINELICNDCQLIKTLRSFCPDISNNIYDPNNNKELHNDNLTNFDTTLFLVKTFNQDDALLQLNKDDKHIEHGTINLENIDFDEISRVISNCKSVNDCLDEIIAETENYVNVEEQNSIENICEHESRDEESNNENNSDDNYRNYELEDSTENNEELKTIYFDNDSVKGFVSGYLKNPTDIKSEYDFDDISPLMMRFETKSESDANLDIMKNATSKELEDENVQNNFSVNSEDDIEIFSMQSEINKDLKVILNAKIINKEAKDKEQFTLDDVEIEDLLIYRNEYDSDDEFNQSDIHLFDQFVKKELEKEKYKKKSSYV